MSTVHDRIQRWHLEVASVFAIAIALRLLLFDYVGIWGDLGFYTYNSRLILEGQTPYVDFLGRSPLFIYLFSAVRFVASDVVTALRSFVVGWWLLTGLPVYAIGRWAADHRSGLVALTVFLWSPFALVYGFWANTQSVAAALALAGLAAIVRSERPAMYAVAGAALGAAFLSRRSVVVIVPALGLYLCWQVWRGEHSLRSALQRLTVAVSSFVIICAVGYVAVASGDVTTAWRLAETHGVNLFLSTGRGGYPLLSETAPAVTREIKSGRVPILNDVCQMCGAWTARTFAKTILVTLTPIGLLWIYVRDWTDEYFIARDRQYLFGILLALAGYAIVLTLWHGYLLRAVGVITAILFGIAIYRGPAVPRRVLYSRPVGLLLFVLAGFTAGYLYRNRLLHTYYFMDFWPALSVVIGIVIVAWWRRATIQPRRVLVIALVIGVVVSVGGAYPLMNIVAEGNSGGWFTTSNVERYGDDIDERTAAGDVVFTATPTYLTGTDARMLNDNARAHYVYATFGRYRPEGPAGELYQSLRPQLRDGTIKLVILDGLTTNMIQHDEETRRLFVSNYCRVSEADALYAQTDAALYRYAPDDCSQRPQLPGR